MKDYLSIGSSPAEEDCAQVGTDNYREIARKECKAYIDQIRRQLGDEPEGAFLAIKSFPHDFGSYLEVVCFFDDNNEIASNYAFKCESETWPNWDAIAKESLAINKESKV